MAYFKIGNGKFEIIKEKPFKLEKEIQKFTEDNLKIVFDLEFVKSELPILNFRIDTLAFDKESKSFVIIEYKRGPNYSVIDQGYAYLSLMLNNKADFILEYNENKKDNLKKDSVDWSQSRVLFVSPSFTTYQQEAINFKDLPIELWEINKYDNDTVNYNYIKTIGSKESVKTISGENDVVTKEIKVYTEQEHLRIASPEVIELYNTFKTAITNLNGIEVKPKKKYIAFLCGKNVVDLHIQKNAIKLWINIQEGQLDDSKGLTRDVSEVGHWGNGDYELQINNDDNIEYIMSLIKQSYKKHKAV